MRSATLLRRAAARVVLTTRTNLCANPNFETNTTGWAAAQGGVIVRDTVTPISGVASLKLTNTGSTGTGALTYRVITGTPGDVLTVSLSYQTAGTVTGTPRIAFSSTEPGVGSELTSLPLTQVTPARFSATTTVPAGGTTYLRVFAPAGLSDVVHIDDVLIEKTASTLAYFDGGHAADGVYTYAWTGTANASTSTATPL